jgi:hypothetical protein
MAIMPKCPACGLESAEIRCPRCNTLKLIGCGGACASCGAACPAAGCASAASPRTPSEDAADDSKR